MEAKQWSIALGGSIGGVKTRIEALPVPPRWKTLVNSELDENLPEGTNFVVVDCHGFKEETTGKTVVRLTITPSKVL